MKKQFLPATARILVFAALLLSIFRLNAQPYSQPDDPKVSYTISNLVVVSDRVLEFDLYLKDLGYSKPIELALIQAGILVNKNIVNGGKITTSIVPGFSDLNAPQQPTIAIWAEGTTGGIIKITPKIYPGPGNGTILKTTGKGTRVCRVRVTNTVPFAKEKPNLNFCFTSAPYPTKAFFYAGTIITHLSINAKNCFNEGENPVLNQ
jgi:hypothetical protein